jgi:glycosyltransferase involved in cell wall biosynthesis
MARALGLADCVLFTNKQDEPPEATDEQINEIYNACDIGINTADHEGWGLVAFEHAATGSPQILTDTNNNREIWGTNALLVGQRGTCVSFAEALTELADPDVRYDMGAKALAHARSHERSWERVVDEWLDIFASDAPAALLNTIPASPLPFRNMALSVGRNASRSQ